MPIDILRMATSCVASDCDGQQVWQAFGCHSSPFSLGDAN